MKTDGTGAAFSFEADLLTSEFLGFDYQYTFETGMGKIVMRSTEELEPDNRYKLYVPDADLFFFDKDQNVCEPFAIGGLKEVQYKTLMAERPEFAMELAVKGMLPKNTLGRTAFTRLHVYRGAEHKHQAQQPVAWTQE